MHSTAASFYKNLFGPADNNLNTSIDIDTPIILNGIDGPCLVEEFTLEEIRIAVFQMKDNKAPGSDGFPAEFCQHSCLMSFIMVG